MATDQHTIAAAIKSGVPQKAGVYLFRGGTGEVIYVGKSVNLRQRMLSYFQADRSKLDSRIRELVFRIRDFSFELTETELLALLLEDRLIKEHLPSYNVRQKEFEQYRYLEVTEDATPICTMHSHADLPTGPRIFGPFRDQYFVEDLLRVIDQCFVLPASLGRESGRDDRAATVGRILDFLEGDEKAAVPLLTRRMNDHSGKLEFERAAEIKEQIELCHRFCERQRFLHDFRSRGLVVLHRADDCVAYTFDRGSFRGHEKVSAGTDLSRLSGAAGSSAPEEDERFVFDRANIVFNWLSRMGDQCEWRFR